MKYDFSDLYDIMAFFKGDVDGRGSKGHDELAAQLGLAGRKWSLTFWRKEDRIAYMFRCEFLRLSVNFVWLTSPVSSDCSWSTLG